MVQLIEGLPPHVLAVKVSGSVSADDYETVIMPALDSMVRRNGEIYFLFVLDTKLADFTLNAIWDDIKTGFKHFNKWKKIAVVSDSVIYDRLIDLLSFLLPGQSRGYLPHQMEEAKAWVSEKT